MGKIKAVALVMLVMLLLSGCKKEELRSLVYDGEAFECEMSWERGGENFRATIVAASFSGEGERDVTLSFIEPSAMRGIRITREAGSVSAELDGMTVDGSDFSGWLDIEKLFCTDGELCFVATEKVSGELSDHLRLVRADGETIDIHISRRDEMPLRISGYEIVAEIIYFEMGE